MSTITIDLVKGNLGRETEEYGIEFQRMAIIEGLSGDADTKVYAAFCDLDSGGYTLNAVHPELASCKLRERNVESIDKDKVRVRLVYRQYGGANGFPPQDTEEIGANVQQKETIVDKDGNTIHAAYDSTDYGGTVTMYTPLITYSKTLSEAASPLSTAATYVGKINSNNGWKIASDQYKWLCTGVNGRSFDGGSTYLVTYSFEYNPNGWTERVIARDLLGNPDPAASDGDGFEDWNVYSQADFSNLTDV